jgi:maltose-binding protein MalE
MNSTNENPGWLAQIDAANAVLAAQGEKIVIEPDIIKTDSWDEYYTKITTNMIGRIGGTIGRIAESHIPLMMEKNQLADITNLVNELLAKKDEDGNAVYNASAFDGVAKKDGKYYGLPSGTQHMVLYYNKTIFDQYNEVIDMKLNNKTVAEIADKTKLDTARVEEIIAQNPSLNKLDYPSGDWNNATTFAQIQDMAKKLSYGKRSIELVLSAYKSALEFPILIDTLHCPLAPLITLFSSAISFDNAESLSFKGITLLSEV